MMNYIIVHRSSTRVIAVDSWASEGPAGYSFVLPDWQCTAALQSMSCSDHVSLPPHVQHLLASLIEPQPQTATFLTRHRHRRGGMPWHSPL